MPAGNLTAAVEAADVIVIAAVVEAGTERATLRPEAYLKGPATAGDIRLRSADPRPRCPLAALESGGRVLALLVEREGDLAWPGASETWALRDGRATTTGFPAVGAVTVAEAGLIDDIRGITGQYAVPAAEGEGGAGIGWWTTVVPVGAALLVVFAIGLVLMRTWHRIDPS